MPEFDYDLDAVVAHVRQITHNRPNPVLVVVAEGIRHPHPGAQSSVGAAVAQELEKRTGFDARCTVLGPLQRGGSPVAFDRLLATAFGARAIHILAAGKSKRVVVWRGGVATEIPLSDVTTGPLFVKGESQLMRTARRLGTYVGEKPSS